MKDRNKRPLFQYLEGFGGVELIQTKNEEGTEHAAWVRNRGNIGGTVWLGFVHPENWKEFEDAFDKMMDKYIVKRQYFFFCIPIHIFHTLYRPDTQ